VALLTAGRGLLGRDIKEAMKRPLEHYLGLEYPAVLVAEPEGGYTALHPDLEGAWPWGRPQRRP